MEYSKKLSRPKDYFEDTCTSSFVIFVFFFFLKTFGDYMNSSLVVLSLIPQVLGSRFHSKLLETIESRFGIPS